MMGIYSAIVKVDPVFAVVIQQPSTSIEFEQPPNENDQDDIDRDSDDGFTPVHSSRPRRANAGQGVNRLNISSFKGKSYQLEALEADFIDKTRSTNDIEQYYEALHSDDYREQVEMKDPIAFAAKMGDDGFHYHEAIKLDDKVQFQSAMHKEFQSHITKKNFELVRVPLMISLLSYNSIRISTLFFFQVFRPIVLLAPFPIDAQSLL